MWCWSVQRGSLPVLSVKVHVRSQSLRKEKFNCVFVVVVVGGGGGGCYVGVV